jgi:hypothetical protein
LNELLGGNQQEASMSDLIERLTAAADRLDNDGDEHGAVSVMYQAARELRKLRASLREAEAALADIGDADREPGDDLAWCERRAASALPNVRATLAG